MNNLELGGRDVSRVGRETAVREGIGREEEREIERLYFVDATVVGRRR